MDSAPWPPAVRRAFIKTRFKQHLTGLYALVAFEDNPKPANVLDGPNPGKGSVLGLV